MDSMHPAALDDETLLLQCRITRSRSGGPGGQNRNKVETHVTIHHEPSGLSAQAGERRSQLENKQMALRRLRLELAVEVRTVPPRLKGKALLDALDKPEGSALWLSRLSGGKIVCNPNHHDFPALLAELMDYLADSNFEPGATGRRLGVTTSQIIKFLKEHPPALLALNRERGRKGLHGLK